MQTLTASDAKREFGDVLLKAQQGPVGINKNGKPVAVVVSANEYQEIEALKQAALRAEIDAGLEDINTGKTVDGKTLFAALKQQIANGEL